MLCPCRGAASVRDIGPGMHGVEVGGSCVVGRGLLVQLLIVKHVRAFNSIGWQLGVWAGRICCIR